MAYTTPRTWSVGEVVTAANMNTYISDNLAEIWSRLNDRTLYIRVLNPSEALTTGDGKTYITIPAGLHGANLISAHAAVYAAATGGSINTFQLARDRAGGGWNDMLSTRITIDLNELSSYTAAAPAVVNASYDDVQQGDRIRIDVDVVGTGGSAGLDIILVFRMP